MTVRMCALLLTLTAAAGAGAEQAKKTGEPFYRKYLVPGNRLDDRILEQEQRVNAAPADANLRNDFGNLLAARHFPRDAAEQYELAAKLDKTNFIALYNLGLLRETEGKFDQAIRAYRRSIERKRGFPPAHFRLGRLYEHGDRADDAVHEYSAALLIDPSMRDPRRNPLVIDSQLMFQASLMNYSRDVASASMAKESVYFEESRFRAVPVDRTVSSQEAAGEEIEPSPEPRLVGVPDTETSTPGARRPGPRPASVEPGSGPAPGRGHPTQSPPRRIVPRGGTPLIAAPPGSSVPPAPPPVEVTPAPSEPEVPPESLPEPTPATPMEEEPS